MLIGQSSKPLLAEKEKFIGIGVGIQRMSVNDEIGSNLTYTGAAATWLLSYATVDTTRLHTLNLRYARTSFTNDLSEGRADGTQLSLRYQYQPKLLRFNRLDANLYLGPYLSFNAFPRSFLYSPYSVTTDTGDFFGSVGLSGTLIKPISVRTFVQASMSVPVISYLLSREFTGSTTQDWAFINQLIDYRFSISYIRALSEKWVFRTDYNFLYYQADRVNDVTYGGHRLLFGLGIRL
ncbi:MAG: hypothetical protein ACFB15_04500 [Cyclobacteriaceae bacterium]